MGGNKNKQLKVEDIELNKKDAKKVAKLQAQIPYHHGRGNKDEVAKIEQQIADIWERTREAAFAMD
eukprot:scaffold104189_cov53-Attheya_sp.AAC.2